MREKQPRLLVIWVSTNCRFDPSEPEAYRRDVPKAEVHIVDGGHFALDTRLANEIAALGENCRLHVKRCKARALVEA